MAEAEDKGKRVVDEGEAPSGDSKEIPSDEKNGDEKEVPSDEKNGVEKNGVEKNGDEKEVPSDEKNGDVSVDIPTEGPSAPPKPAPKAIPEPTILAQPKDYVDPNAVPFWDPSELKRWSLWRAGIAEFIASFLFLYISVQTVIGSAANGSGGVGTLGIAFAFGVTIFVLVYAIAGISGGHINPAITFAFLLVRRVSFARFLIFVIAQVLGSLAGVGLVKAYQKGYYQRYGGGANFVHYGYSRGAGFVAELVGTFLLVYVVFTATDAKRKQRDAHVPVLAPLAIGLAVFVIHLATIPITGTGINPARSFAAACYWDHHDHAWHDQWIFWVAPLLGATVAATYYQYVIRATPFRYVDLASLQRGRPLQWGRPRPTV